MKIRGILATKRQQLSPDLWVNVWEIDLCFAQNVNYYTSCQVKELDEILATSDLTPEDYLLEILDAP